MGRDRLSPRPKRRRASPIDGTGPSQEAVRSRGTDSSCVRPNTADVTESTDLSGRVCIVTGGGRGIGAEAARALAEQGATVVVNDLGNSMQEEGESAVPARDVVESIEDDGGQATTHLGDVSDLDYVESLVEDTLEEHGRLDSVANFAGVLRDGYLTNLSEADWDDVIRVHLKGHFALLRAAARHWRQEADGDALDPRRSFLAVTSRSALGNVGQLNYGTAKAGVLGFTRSASTELYSTGVRVNALMPSAFTRMTESIPEEHRSYTREEMPPEKVAPAVAFLASDAARDVTGVTVYAGGDRVAVYSDPEPARAGVRPGGWTAESLADSFEEIAEGVELTRTDSLV